LRELEVNARELKQIEQLVMLTKDVDPDRLAENKVSFAVFYRRRMFWRIFRSSPSDYVGIETLLDYKDPDAVSFPLRFMSQLMAAGDYLRLRRKWMTGTPKEEILLAVQDGDPSEGTGLVDELLDLNQRILPYLRQDRSGAIQELEESYRRECFLAAALVGITQVEGIIWDFASYLNRRNIRVFRRAGLGGRALHPYPWDRELCRYKRTLSPHWDTSIRLRSARAVLEHTRVGGIIAPELFSYLVDEFYDDRNPLAHGRTGARNFQTDAIAAVLAFYACMQELARYLKVLGEGDDGEEKAAQARRYT
jgi:hypothetical protein